MISLATELFKNLSKFTIKKPFSSCIYWITDPLSLESTGYKWSPVQRASNVESAEHHGIMVMKLSIFSIFYNFLLLNAGIKIKRSRAFL